MQAELLADQQMAGLLMVAACPLSYVLVAVIVAAHVIMPALRRRGSLADSGTRQRRLSMNTPAPRRLAAIAVWALTSAAGLALALFLLAWSGMYNVAASRGHWAFVEWFLAFGMRNSVELRAMAIRAPALDDPNLIKLGAAHFHGGCAFCHGAPGIPVSPIARQMLPSPPDLATSMRPWTDEELFWIVQHGIKYTGMPGWVALERADEIWAVVAFLKRMPLLNASSYARTCSRRRAAGKPGR